MNKENTIFYIRYLQKKLYFRNSELIGAMFNLEKYLLPVVKKNVELMEQSLHYSYLNLYRNDS